MEGTLISQPFVDTPRTPHRQQRETGQANVPSTEIVTQGYSASTVPPDRHIPATSQTNTAPLVTSSVQRPLEPEATLSLTKPIPQAHSKHDIAISASPVDAVPPSLSPAHVMTSSQEARPAAKQEQAIALEPHKESLASTISYKDDGTRQRPTNASAHREDEDALKPVPKEAVRPRPVPLLPRLEEKADSSQARAAEKQHKATLHIGSIDVYIVPPPAPVPPAAADIKSTPRPRPTGSLSRELISPIGLRQG